MSNQGARLECVTMHIMNPKEIGARLKAARLAVHMTQLGVATRLRLARSSISMIENGSRHLRPGELELFAAQYGIRTTDITNCSPQRLPKG